MTKSILIIDDDRMIGDELTKFLLRLGFDPYKASTVATARAACRARTFSAILMDQLLPDGNGIDLLPELRDQNPDAAIVVITGSGDIPSAVEACGAARIIFSKSR